MAVLLEFQWAEARSVARRIVVPRAVRRNDATRRRSRLELAGAGVAAKGVVGELELVPLADEHRQRAIAVPRRLGHGRHPAPQQCHGGLQLAGSVLLRERGGDVLSCDAELAQAALDPLGAPG